MQTYLRMGSKNCQQKCQQRVLNILVCAVAEHERIVSTNRVEFIISTLKRTRSTDESYLRSQTALPFGEARELHYFGIRIPWVRAEE
jgi:hypothetical protein